MPLYEYECRQCHRRTEKIQKFSDPELTTCPHCGGPLERTITAPAVSFKGGGWYKDLYSSAKPASAPSSEGSKASSGSGADSASSSGSKPDAGASSSTPANSSSSSTPSSAPASNKA